MGKMHENRLVHEKSPYLLQHAHNPVNWYPWGPEAFEAARREQKPIFLSIGYSTCHWCHVMERESFENEEIAAILNRSFIPIKVDREERPDVDRIYMSYVQASTGGGGWPMSVWLTPDLRPFVGGTYFPPDNRYGRAGFPVVLERIAEAWRQDRDKILASSNTVLEQLQKQAEVAAEGRAAADSSALDSGFNGFRRIFDSRHGGFGQAPKFPRPVVHNFLLRYHARTNSQEALSMVLDTLRAMAQGGMNDQLGGGFHRYSVDEYWFVPHFEKMLYDQAQLAMSYLEAFQITKEGAFATEARRIFDYVLRDMTDPEGGFYSAEDADSVIDPADPHEKGEGAFYIWTQAEIEAIVGQPAARWFCYRYGVKTDGNVRSDPHNEFGGRNILFLEHSLEDVADHFEEPLEEITSAIGNAGRKLFDARAKRVRPHLDDKVLTAWNGLMIGAFAKAGAILEDPRYADAALRATDFVMSRMYQSGDGILLRRYRQGDAAIPGFLDDYAFFVQALLDQYEASFDMPHLEWAITLTEKQIELFEDKQQGGFFSTAAGDPNLVMRMKDDYDGAEPSGNSIAALNLLRLSGITGRDDFREAAVRTLQAFAGRITETPFGVPQMLVAFEFDLATPKQVILAGEKDSPEMRQMLQVLHARFLPNAISLLIDNEQTRRALARFNPAVESMHLTNGSATAFVCENFACKLPTNDPVQFAELLQ